MTDIIENVREQARARGFKEGANAERLQTIGLLGRIRAAPDVEAALHDELEKLEALQASEVSALHTRPATPVDDAAVEQQYDLIARVSGRGGSAPTDARDNGDKVADAMGLPAASAANKPAPSASKPASPTTAKPPGATQPEDNGDLVAAAMGL